jgi:hypothetical protein
MHSIHGCQIPRIKIDTFVSHHLHLYEIELQKLRSDCDLQVVFVAQYTRSWKIPIPYPSFLSQYGGIVSESRKKLRGSPLTLSSPEKTNNFIITRRLT